jgi:DNA polymerase I-like protein with 3'-5' exonuclease and polymerase domains
VQNWSMRAGGGVENLRRMIAAPEGFVFVGADQKQLEARLIAACSQDPFLIDVFKRGADIHGELAGVAFVQWPQAAEVYAKHKPQHKLAKTRGYGCGTSQAHPYCEMCESRDKMRDLTKRLEYGAFYGGTVDTLWKSVVKDYPDIKPASIGQFMQNVGQRMPGVISWRTNVLRDAIAKGEIRSPILGRREVFPLAHLGRVEATVAYNFLPQSGGADLWAIGAAKFMDLWNQWAEKDDTRYARICHNGHDSVLILTKESCADEVERDVHTCWEMIWNDVPFLMDCKRGHRWSEV